MALSNNKYIGEMEPILTYYKPNLMFQTEVPCAWGTSYNKCSADTTLSSCGSERDGMIARGSTL